MTSNRTQKMRKEKLLILGSAAFAMLLLGAAASYWPAGHASSVGARTTPDLTALLPVGSVAMAQAELPDAPQNALVVAFRNAETDSLGLIVWDKREQRYSLTSSAVMDEAASLKEVTLVTTGSLGLGAPMAVFVHGKTSSNAEHLQVFARTGDAIVPVPKVDVDGSLSLAVFPDGSMASGNAYTSFEDVDGDGDNDAIIKDRPGSRGTTEGGFIVHAWRDGAFHHDVELTRIVSLRDSLFPEPEAPPVDVGTP